MRARTRSNLVAITGLLLMAAGIIFGAWAGIWWAFIGGIIDVIAAVKAPDLIPMDLAIGIAKVIFAAPIGWLSVLFAAAPGYAMLKSA